MTGGDVSHFVYSWRPSGVNCWLGAGAEVPDKDLEES